MKTQQCLSQVSVTAFSILKVQEDQLVFHKLVLLRTFWSLFYIEYTFTEEEGALNTVLERCRDMPGDLQAHAHSSQCPPLNSPASLIIGWGHVTSFSQRTVVESEMCQVKVKAVESLCLPLSLSLSLPLHGDLGGCPFLVEQPRDEGRQCVLHWALYSSEQELNYYMKLVRFQGFFVTAGHSSLS